MDERLISLESKIGFLEDAIDEINRVVYRQQQHIDQLQQQIRMLYAQLQSAALAERRDPRDEIPPHY